MSRIPPGVRRGVEAALRDAGRDASLTDERDVGGGCINRAVRVTTEDGAAWFLKWNEDADPRMFEVEAEGLRALAAPGVLRVPAVAGWGDADGVGWLLLEHVDPGNPGPGYAEALGRGLAELHRAGAEAPPTAPSWGWSRDNFIGSLPQANDPRPDWPTFWRELRLEPQLRRARDGGFLGGSGGRDVDDAVGRVDEAVAGAAEADGPSLLHGDLWGGNVFADASGAPVLIDPAVYRGHREVDLAMSELFGGFPPGFLEAYDAAWPLAPGYREVRRPLYQLYFLLVHVNLFGSGYVGRTVSAARAVLAGL